MVNVRSVRILNRAHIKPRGVTPQLKFGVRRSGPQAGTSTHPQPLRGTDVSGSAVRAAHAAISKQINELKQLGPEWDGPDSTTPEPALLDLTADWLGKHWRTSLGIPDICPASDGGVSISWKWGAIEHSLDVRSDGSGMEWCRYDPLTLQTVETKLSMNRRGWDTLQAGLEQSVA
ncbi:MAG: hypothetical protein OXG36_18595 [Caldilineaceae bacterium]|nr:hypothetical protein [Caldilineaceae bacterium]